MPLSWTELSPEERARVQDNFEENSVLRDLVRYENGVVMPRVFAEQLADRIYDMKLTSGSCLTPSVELPGPDERCQVRTEFSSLSFLQF